MDRTDHWLIKILDSRHLIDIQRHIDNLSLNNSRIVLFPMLQLVVVKVWDNADELTAFGQFLNSRRIQVWYYFINSPIGDRFKTNFPSNSEREVQQLLSSEELMVHSMSLSGGPFFPINIEIFEDYEAMD